VIEQYSSCHFSTSTTPSPIHPDNFSSIDYNSSISPSASYTTTSPLTINDIINYKKRNGQPLRFGVSRPGSGSHTMAYYTAMLCGIQQQDIEIVAANNFDGLRAG